MAILGKVSLSIPCPIENVPVYKRKKLNKLIVRAGSDPGRKAVLKSDRNSNSKFIYSIFSSPAPVGSTVPILCCTESSELPG